MLALADGAAPDARALGIAESIRDYCAKADSTSVEKYQFQIARLTRGANAETLAKVRNSDEYHKARAAEDDFVSKVDPHNAKRICSKSLVARR